MVGAVLPADLMRPGCGGGGGVGAGRGSVLLHEHPVPILPVRFIPVIGVVHDTIFSLFAFDFVEELLDKPINIKILFKTLFLQC